jgi:hypothetical protein
MRLFGNQQTYEDKQKILKLVELAKKGRTEPQLRHVLDQWKITGLKQSRIIREVKEKL